MSEMLSLEKITTQPKGEIFVGGSKSESNRLLILSHLYPNTLKIENLSDSEDTTLLKKALEEKLDLVDIHHAGTAMRFLTAFYSIQLNSVIKLTGSERMKQRPIGILVDALRNLGADIQYLEKEGFPPLLIKGKKIEITEVELDANVSSQFITALMLIAPKLEHGLTIHLKGKITSLPYLNMTIAFLKKLGIKIIQKENSFKIFPKSALDVAEITVESDWSSASYFYSLAALAKNPEIYMNSYFIDSLQGDSALIQLYYDHFGVKSEFFGNQIKISKEIIQLPEILELDLNSTPDIAQTLAVTCTGLKLKCHFTGLETLKVKETDRLIALKNELEKLGAMVEITDDSLKIIGFREVNEVPIIKTYNDHRMAMSFAPLILIRNIEIENPEIVSKSYPKFWEDLFRLL